MTGAVVSRIVGEAFVDWQWVADHTDDIWERTLEHLQLTAWAVGIGLVLSIFLSLVALRWRRTFAPITFVAGVLYTIPSLALFAFLIPYTGLGFHTALIGLVSYTLLILVRNIVTGVDGVPHSVKEAADAMGYTYWRRLWTVDLRLATPTIVAGIRIATVTVIGLVTVTALVGNGGYGALIKDGLNRNFSTPIVVGTVLSVALAVVADVFLAAVGRALTPWTRKASV